LGIGVDELRWLAPVRPGDKLHLEGEVLELKPSKSRSEKFGFRSKELGSSVASEHDADHVGSCANDTAHCSRGRCRAAADKGGNVQKEPTTVRVQPSWHPVIRLALFEEIGRR